MKKIYWIDDSWDNFSDILNGAICSLWGIDKDSEKRIISNVFIFDTWEEWTSEKKSRAVEAEKAIFYQMEELLNRSYNQINPLRHSTDDREYVALRKELLESGKIKYILGNIADTDKEFYSNLQKQWRDEKTSEIDEELIKKFLLKLNLKKNNSVIALDVALFDSDITRVLNMEKIFSLELFHLLKNEGYGCFLYSQDGDRTDFTNNVKTILKEKYDINDPTLINTHLLSIGGSEETINKIYKMCEVNR